MGGAEFVGERARAVSCTIWLYPFNLVLFAINHRDAGAVILFGSGFKNVMDYLAARMIGAKVILRLGGNTETVEKFGIFVIDIKKIEINYYPEFALS